MKVKVKGKDKSTKHVKLDISKQLLRMLIVTGGNVGAPSTYVHSSITRYVSKHVDGVSMIDLSTTCSNMLSLYKLIRLLIKRKHTILVVANTPDHARLASTLLEGVANNVYVLTKRWNPGIFSNYNRFSKIIHVYKRISDKNKSDSMKRQYASKYAPIEHFYTKRLLPRLVIFIDIVGIDTAIAETTAMGIPTVGFVNTDYGNSDALTYVMPLGGSVQASALIITVLRHVIIQPIKATTVIRRRSKRNSFKRRRIWFGKLKWKNSIVPATKSRLVSKYLIWNIRRKARKVNRVKYTKIVKK